MVSFKVQVREYSFNGKSVFKLIEKGYLLGVRFYTEEYKTEYSNLEEAKIAADKLYNKLVTEKKTSYKDVWTIKG